MLGGISVGVARSQNIFERASNKRIDSEVKTPFNNRKLAEERATVQCKPAEITTIKALIWFYAGRSIRSTASNAQFTSLRLPVPIAPAALGHGVEAGGQFIAALTALRNGECTRSEIAVSHRVACERILKSIPASRTKIRFYAG
jgi:hypothetical protein